MNIADLNMETLTREVEKMGEKPFRAKQIFSWIYKGVESFEDMTNLSQNLRMRLSETYKLYLPTIEQKWVSAIDGTVKYLLKMKDGEFVETVIMKYKYGYTACVSTQIGCRMGCAFCASTLHSLTRNLAPNEITGQILRAQKDMNITISHVVFMGMGEPLDNYDSVLSAIRLLNHPDGLNIGIRHFTISTCGLVKSMIQLADEEMPITLAVSLHAPHDGIRNQIMPISKAYPYGALMDACRYYTEKTNRRITFEYTLIDSLNDSEECAEKLADQLHGLLCHVNLIPINPVKERGLKRPNQVRVQKFLNVLEKRKIEATIRRELGADIDASCGQLRNRHKQGTEVEDWNSMD